MMFTATGLRRPGPAPSMALVLRWWEWLGRILITVVGMAVSGFVVFFGLFFALAPSSVSNSDWHEKVVVPMYFALAIAAAVSVLVGTLCWRLLRQWDVGPERD